MWGLILKWILPIVVDLAVKWGAPAAIEWIMKKLPFIPKQLLEELVLIIKKAVEDLANVTPQTPEAVAIRKEAKQKARDCVGAMCVSDTKGLD
jgi:hypothetical protein